MTDQKRSPHFQSHHRARPRSREDDSLRNRDGHPRTHTTELPGDTESHARPRVLPRSHKRGPQHAYLASTGWCVRRAQERCGPSTAVRVQRARVMQVVELVGLHVVLPSRV